MLWRHHCEALWLWKISNLWILWFRCISATQKWNPKCSVTAASLLRAVAMELFMPLHSWLQLLVELHHAGFSPWYLSERFPPLWQGSSSVWNELVLLLLRTTCITIQTFVRDAVVLENCVVSAVERLAGSFCKTEILQWCRSHYFFWIQYRFNRLRIWLKMHNSYASLSEQNIT